MCYMHRHFQENRIKLEEYGLADKIRTDEHGSGRYFGKRAIQEEHAEGKVFISR